MFNNCFHNFVDLTKVPRLPPFAFDAIASPLPLALETIFVGLYLSTYTITLFQMKEESNSSNRRMKMASVVWDEEANRKRA
jgi:hypothetical protein